MSLLCVTVDLDEIHCYHAIHGLDKPEGDMARVVYRRALLRVAQFLEEFQIPGTFFVVGNDLLKEDEAGSVLRDLLGRGHEMGNHSMHHRYDLTLLNLGDQTKEIDRAADTIEQVVGVRPRGFRAPGYNIHAGLTDLLKRRNYRYDSSVFPCPAYYSAKAAAIGVKMMQGRRSASIIGDPRILKAPTGPYRMGRDGVWTRGEELIELPITVVTSAKLPFIGTSLALMGALPASLLARAAARLPFVNLELHGIDFADADGDGLGHLKKYQHDLRIPLVKRKKTLSRVVKTLLDAGFDPITMTDAAERVFI
ncbi:MAG: polysaccharide deacetylase family protein [Proteobacteria bacterium]|nr:polysaccharide deacetylase family protein [Pseudomonadota bacterium]